MSVGCGVAYSLWAVAVVLFIAVMVTAEVRVLPPALLAMGAAATATVRTYFVEFSAMVRRAFEVDADSVTTLPRPR